MSPSSPTRQRLTQAARKLFAERGITETTTKQIAELAQVNEVTLFRQFGSKQGLLLAVLEDAEIFARLSDVLGKQARRSPTDLPLAFRHYASAQLNLLEQVPEFIRSLVGEAGNYSVENRQALGKGLTQVSRYTATYLQSLFPDEHPTALSADSQARLLNCLLLGFAVLEFTSEFTELWPDRDAFLSDVVQLFAVNAPAGKTSAPTTLPSAPVVSDLARSKPTPEPSTALMVDRQPNRDLEAIADLPAGLVHGILQQAKKSSLQDYALAYALFAAGLSAVELASLERSHYIHEPPLHLLQIPQGCPRQVPINAWILGQRYGSKSRNPLSIWLRSRKDSLAAMFTSEDDQQPAAAADIARRWDTIVADLLTPQGGAPRLEQARQTWCIDMLMRGMNKDDLILLTGWDTDQINPYIHRAAEKAALSRAMELDRKQRER